jgi:hypothetical protein
MTRSEDRGESGHVAPEGSRSFSSPFPPGSLLAGGAQSPLPLPMALPPLPMALPEVGSLVSVRAASPQRVGQLLEEASLATPASPQRDTALTDLQSPGPREEDMFRATGYGAVSLRPAAVGGTDGEDEDVRAEATHASARILRSAAAAAIKESISALAHAQAGTTGLQSSLGMFLTAQSGRGSVVDAIVF